MGPCKSIKFFFFFENLLLKKYIDCSVPYFHYIFLQLPAQIMDILEGITVRYVCIIPLNEDASIRKVIWKAIAQPHVSRVVPSSFERTKSMTVETRDGNDASPSD